MMILPVHCLVDVIIISREILLERLCISKWTWLFSLKGDWRLKSSGASIYRPNISWSSRYWWCEYDRTFALSEYWWR